MKELSNDQKNAIKGLKSAIARCKKAKILLFGMDHELLFVTESAVKDALSRFEGIGKNYNPAADTYQKLQYETDERIGTIVSKLPYVDSGGW